eukprot:14883967-Alexandrium_andersonii.AAC.1
MSQFSGVANTLQNLEVRTAAQVDEVKTGLADHKAKQQQDCEALHKKLEELTLQVQALSKPVQCPETAPATPTRPPKRGIESVTPPAQAQRTPPVAPAEGVVDR